MYQRSLITPAALCLVLAWAPPVSAEISIRFGTPAHDYSYGRGHSRGSHRTRPVPPAYRQYDQHRHGHGSRHGAGPSGRDRGAGSSSRRDSRPFTPRDSGPRTQPRRRHQERRHHYYRRY